MAFPDVFIVEELEPQFETVQIEEVYENRLTTLTRYDTVEPPSSMVEVIENGLSGATVSELPVAGDLEEVEVGESPSRHVQLVVVVDADEDSLSSVEIRENEATIPGTTIISVPNDHAENHVVEIQEGSFEAPTAPTGEAFLREHLLGIVDGVNVVFEALHNVYVPSALVFVCGILQTPGAHYTIAGKTISFEDPLEAGEVAEIFYQVST